MPKPVRVSVPTELLSRPWLRSLVELLSAGRGGVQLLEARDEAAFVRARLDAALDLPGEGYRLRLGPNGLDLLARAPFGLARAGATMAQWIALHSDEERTAGRLGAVEIEDWPEFAHRAVMLDVSRNKVPTRDSLLHIVDLLAGWKINQLQLYTEHTFAYAGHEDVWRNASPLTAGEIRELDAYCAEREVELVPNQQSFGHMHRWLALPSYRRLAECPQGVDHPFSRRREPFSLCPVDEASLALLDDLYAQLLPNFSSPLFNVGLDETFDLGHGRSSRACAERGRGRVYLDFLLEVHRRVRRHGRRMLFWGDVVLQHPDLVSELPDEAVALLWGYEADHPFDEQCAVVAESGLDFYVCPGTSSWNSFAGRWSNARENLAGAARAGADHAALGYLVTDWGDSGHLQPWPVSLPGLLAGACFAWNPEEARDPRRLPVAELLERWATLPPGGGEVLLALGDLYRETGRELVNGTVPFRLLVSARDPLAARGLDTLEADALLRTAQHGRDLADQADTLATEGEEALVGRELAWAGRAVALGCDIGRARLSASADAALENLPAGERRNLLRGLAPLVAERRALWLERNRPGGVEDSLGYLRSVARLLER